LTIEPDTLRPAGFIGGLTTRASENVKGVSPVPDTGRSM